MFEGVERDERAILVENAGYRWAYLIQAFGILGVILYGSATGHAESWPLFLVLLAGGAVAGGYQAAHRILGPRRLAIWVITAGFALAVALLMARVFR